VVAACRADRKNALIRLFDYHHQALTRLTARALLALDQRVPCPTGWQVCCVLDEARYTKYRPAELRMVGWDVTVLVEPVPDIDV
jgi:hypothetical protein